MSLNLDLLSCVFSIRWPTCFPVHCSCFVSGSDWGGLCSDSLFNSHTLYIENNSRRPCVAWPISWLEFRKIQRELHNLEVLRRIMAKLYSDTAKKQTSIYHGPPEDVVVQLFIFCVWIPFIWLVLLFVLFYHILYNYIKTFLWSYSAGISPFWLSSDSDIQWLRFIFKQFSVETKLFRLFASLRRFKPLQQTYTSKQQSYDH